MNKKGKVPEIYYLQAEFCKTIAQPKRLMIIEKLSQKPMTITELSEELGFSPPNISQHIKSLVEKGVLNKIREKNRVYYKLSFPEVLKASRLVRDVMIKIFQERGKLAGDI